MKTLSLLELAGVLATTACQDQPTQPELAGPSLKAVSGEASIPAPKLYYALANGRLTLTWSWGDDQTWDLVSFDLEVGGRAIAGDWNIKPYAATDGGFYESYIFSWSNTGFGESLPQACVSVMAKNRSDKGTPTTTYHAQNCSPIPFPVVTDSPPLRPETITSGMSFSCGLSSSGEAYCWGFNAYGQLGNGTTTSRSTAWPVAGGLTFTQISAGGWESTTYDYPGHACALTSLGEAYCWGYNSLGALGDGTNVSRLVPTPVAGALRFSRIAVGAGNTCAITTTGDVYCWGYNNYGQLGDGTRTNRSTPTLVLGGLKFAQISTGGRSIFELLSHTCGVTTTGMAYCWGANGAGEIGDGVDPDIPATAVPSPVAVAGSLTFRQVSAGGAHTCGVTTANVAYCWGNGARGQVGSGSFTVPFRTPSAVAGGLSFSRISAGGAHTCGLATNGSTYCWGDNTTGQLGVGGYQWAVPMAVTNAPNATQISAGDGHTCIVSLTGAAYCWGGDSFGQIGNGQSGLGGVAGIPTRVRANVAFQQLSAGYHHACGLTGAGEAYCWGDNVTGQLGDGTTSQQTIGVKLDVGSPFTQISTGELHTCGLYAGGTAACWGWNLYGQLGDGTNADHSSPAPIFGFDFAYIDVGNEHTCGLISGGVAYCWGHNENGQLGDGTTTNRKSPTLVAGGFAFRKISAGTAHTCGLTISGQAYCWGRNGSTEVHVPFLVENGPAFTELTTGDRFTCGLTSSGAAHCWGVNNSGQLGDGTSDGKPYPTPVVGGLTFAQISAGFYHTCGVTTAGVPYCWGWNIDGQLGDGTTTTRLTPNPVSGGLALDKISGGGDFTCGVANSRVTYCWGTNNYGQLGDGTTAAHLTPNAAIAWLVFRS